MDASRVCSGTFGHVYIDGEEYEEVQECTADETMDKKDVILVGSTRKKFKCGLRSGAGTLKGYKVTSKILELEFKKFEILTELDDPEAFGAERIRLKGCMFDKLSLVNFKAGELCEEETPFTYDDYELVDPIKAN